jgi:hypothetical protein
MKYVVLFALLATSTPALADTKSICVDASSRSQYNARPLSRHDVLARNALGAEKRVVRLTTTCIHIYRDAFVALRSLTNCISMGDDVGVSTLDGRHERCKVTGVVPVAESYVDAKYRDD